jgi:hypothetical protein
MGAIADYSGALRIDPNLAEAHHLRGDACRALKLLDVAVACYAEAIRCQPGWQLSRSLQNECQESLRETYSPISGTP